MHIRTIACRPYYLHPPSMNKNKKTKIAEYEKAIPAAHLFNAISFTGSNPGENDKFYISNIKITKD